jgi:hypothetical protein
VTKTQIIKCDRCGTLADEYIATHWSHIYRYTQGYSEGLRVDLCPACYVLLADFLDNEPKKDTHAATL